MSRSISSLQQQSHNDYDEDNTSDHQSEAPTPTSPSFTRRIRIAQASDLDLRLRSRMPTRSSTHVDEYSSLLENSDSTAQRYTSVPPTPRPLLSRHQSTSNSIRRLRHHSRSGSFSQRLTNALISERQQAINSGALDDSIPSLYPGDFYNDERVWYDQFTSTDWVHDSIADAFRVKALRSRKGIRGRLVAWFDGVQGWLLVAIIGCITAITAYFVDVTETAIFDVKEGFCKVGWYYSKRKCCLDSETCDSWASWSQIFRQTSFENKWIDFSAYVTLVVLLSTASCLLTLTTRTVAPSAVRLSTLDENLGADVQRPYDENDESSGKRGANLTQQVDSQLSPATTYYSAAGSGVAEVKVILSGFVLHGYLGVKTLVIKTLALILSVASGLSLGKEGPYVHIATCIGNISCRMFSKYNHNDGKRREVLSASAASGVAVAFGAPIGGVLFSLEEVSYYFPPKTLFRTFFCCIAAALSLKFLNPYGTNKIVLFEVRYVGDWRFFEMIAFILLGILGGAAGALFIKASRFWARTFRRIPFVKQWPIFEVVLVASITGIVSFWNRYTKLAVTELLFELASPCDRDELGTGLCPPMEEIPKVIYYLSIAFVIKSLLTIVTFGIKVPAGIYVPSMVAGGLMGRIVGHTVQYLVFKFPDVAIFGTCPYEGEGTTCVTPGVYAMVAAGATMCGVTRLSVALAVILFELTGSLNHVLPFSIAILVSKWTADAMEPHSIYVGIGSTLESNEANSDQDLLTDMNSYPFLNNKVRPIFTGELGDITPRVRKERVIDISQSPLILARELRRKLDILHTAGEIDGGLPIVRNKILVGLIPAPDLEFALDKLENEENSLCLMATHTRWETSDGEDEPDADPTDFTPYIDPKAPVALEIRSPMDLVYECFVKLGLRYICVLRDGQYAGLIHKKAFVKYIKELEES
ncbi:hypothetical protein GP486_001010 [Trichoglossum hirsutum]|uniref:Chloride channel protein n=1 Tax=Trichoglossum hirsutum TaxID=265104 RepID=A0A9P8LHQ2_9PEZI|nr:hypothetical protein GP486_001010 [Trichoglossum hirsutum]